ncbi:C39 family peptidase [Bacillus pinisoli]|uniref:C39 family peptidase n=1 Tax=Bacillus pinisoli TaxID=2901866 RepID=UPI001FF1BE13|nr:C39 family peptidase [Bacillus pinisoli]
MSIVIMVVLAVLILLLTYHLLSGRVKPMFVRIAFLYNIGFVLLFTFLFWMEAHTYFNTLHKKTNIETLALESVDDEQFTEEPLIKGQVLIDAPIIKQYPELPRGCEVTSLAMLLQYKGINTNKLELAERIKKDTTLYRRKENKIYFGNPNDGFVGDMYNLNKPGYGVYHEPIRELAEQYLPGEILDITGSDFEYLKFFLSNGNPVWIITNATFKVLGANSFQEWETPTGRVRITYREHSVLVTGYDENYVYFNDPLSGEKNKKEPLTDFIHAWEQMGSQAITVELKPQ